MCAHVGIYFHLGVTLGGTSVINVIIGSGGTLFSLFSLSLLYSRFSLSSFFSLFHSFTPFTLLILFTLSTFVVLFILFMRFTAGLGETESFLGSHLSARLTPLSPHTFAAMAAEKIHIHIKKPACDPTPFYVSSTATIAEVRPSTTCSVAAFVSRIPNATIRSRCRKVE